MPNDLHTRLTDDITDPSAISTTPVRRRPAPPLDPDLAGRLVTGR